MGRHLIVGAFLIAAISACSSDSSSGWAPSGDGDASATGGASGEGGSSGQGGATGQGGSGKGGSSTGGSSTGGSSTGGSGGSSDPYEAQRQECIDKINEFRATKGLPAYTRWKEAESCVDQQATADEKANSPHGAWQAGTYPSCNGSGQNECLGGGASGIIGCLDMMWAEKDQTGCSGCDACTGPGGCANCDFYGSSTGDVCGHYVNMSAKWFTRAACGFSSQGGWAAINFQ